MSKPNFLKVTRVIVDHPAPKGPKEIRAFSYYISLNAVISFTSYKYPNVDVIQTQLSFDSGLNIYIHEPIEYVLEAINLVVVSKRNQDANT